MCTCACVSRFACAGWDTLLALEKYGTKQGHTKGKVFISACGQLLADGKTPAPNVRDQFAKNIAQGQGAGAAKPATHAAK